MPTQLLTRLEDAVAALLNHARNDIRLAAPLGLGKPHRLLNAIYRRASTDAELKLQIYTALSLTPGGTISFAGTSVEPEWSHGKSDSNMLARRSKTSTK